jgi:pyruvate/2-oxoglutarate dehydrogenase complex dihydrolipoamide dehydrogenase (E3) component
VVDWHDLIVLGTGVGGAEVAAQAAGQGLDVLAIEQRLVGGECPYWGCIPSKAMARASGVLGEAARVGQLAGKSAVEPDWTVLARRVAEVSEHWDDARAADRLERRGATLLRGRGRILGPAEVEVGGRRLAARKGLVIATGTEPAIPSIDGLSGVPYWTNREAVEAGAVPRSLVVLGAGAVGLELAQAFGRFGAEVTVVEAAGHALPMEEPENSAGIDEALRRDGITLITGTTATAAASSERGITVELSDGTHLEAERLLVATGRRPDLRSLGVAELGIDPDAPSVATDENLRAGDGAWAVGDVTGHGAFTHVAYYQAQIAAADILGTEHEPADYTAVPRVTFTDPEVASVGLTEAAARARGLDVRVGLLPTSSSDRGWLHGPGADLGVTKVVADAAAGVLVGGSAMGPASGEVVAFLALAIRARIPVGLLMEVIYPYPTFTRGVRGALRRLG